MIPFIVRYGLIAGVIVVIPMLWIMLTLPADAGKSADMTFNHVTGYLTMIVALTAVFLGIKRYRDKALGGVIKFGQALGIGLGITAVASVLYVIGWEIAMAFSKFDFIAWYQHMMIEGARAKGAEAVAKATAEAEAFANMYRNPAIRMAFTFIEMFPVGILISLISAALLRNPRLLPARAA